MHVRRWRIAAVVTAFGLATGACGANRSIVATGPLDERAIPVAPECRPGVMPDGAAGHQHMTDPAHDVIAVLDTTECALLQAQLDVAARTAQRYPTVRDARRAGYVRLGVYAEGVAAHYVKQSIYDDRFDPAAPEFLLYDGVEPDSTIVGVSYAARQRAYPELFVGPNDHSHRHAWCPARTPGGEAREPGDPGCTEANAQGADEWLLHAWVVPGRESPYGVFSPINPYLTAHGWDPDDPIGAVDGESMALARRAIDARLAAGGTAPAGHDHSAHSHTADG